MLRLKRVSGPRTQHLRCDSAVCPREQHRAASLRFTNMNVGLSDFVEDPANPNVYTYTLPGNAPASTSVIFVSGDVVTVNGAEQEQWYLLRSCHPHRHQHHHGGVRRENLQPHLEPDPWHRRQSRRWRWVSHPAHLPAQHSGDRTWHRNGQPRPAPSGGGAVYGSQETRFNLSNT